MTSRAEVDPGLQYGDVELDEDGQIILELLPADYLTRKVELGVALTTSDALRMIEDLANVVERKIR